jgi:hypothetical protein
MLVASSNGFGGKQIYLGAGITLIGGRIASKDHPSSGSNKKEESGFEDKDVLLFLYDQSWNEKVPFLYPKPASFS